MCYVFFDQSRVVDPFGQPRFSITNRNFPERDVIAITITMAIIIAMTAARIKLKVKLPLFTWRILI